MISPLSLLGAVSAPKPANAQTAEAAPELTEGFEAILTEQEVPMELPLEGLLPPKAELEAVEPDLDPELAAELPEIEDLEVLPVPPTPVPSMPIVEGLRAVMEVAEREPEAEPIEALPAMEEPATPLLSLPPQVKPKSASAPVKAELPLQVDQSINSLKIAEPIEVAEPVDPRPTVEVKTVDPTVRQPITVQSDAPQPTLDLPEGFAPLEAKRVEDLPAPDLPEVEAPATKPVAPLVKNVLDRMAEVEISEGKTRILLRPQGLGILELDLTRRADGQLQLAIRVENPLILEALRQEGSALGSFMGERGFDLSGGGADLGRYSPPSSLGEASEAAAADETADTHSDLLTADRLNILT